MQYLIAASLVMLGILCVVGMRNETSRPARRIPTTRRPSPYLTDAADRAHAAAWARTR